MSLREKKKIETKNKIIEVGGRLFKEKGFNNTTVDEIAREAEIGKGTFFNYFPTKEALLREFDEQKQELVYNLARNELKRSIPTREKIKNILVSVAKSNEKDKELTRLFVFEYLRHYGYEERRSDSLNTILQDLLENGIKTGDVKNGLDIKRAAENLTAIYYMSLMEWLWSKSDYSFSEDISKKIDMIFDGIGS
ncbi:MAG: TetR/AcrR family transcriptional regulator [Candidatus Methanoperedens sp.]|nr:TetR/AcrR family transcriptional regulator [Candidatus Methanoperedens sp.]